MRLGARAGDVPDRPTRLLTETGATTGARWFSSADSDMQSLVLLMRVPHPAAQDVKVVMEKDADVALAL